MTTAADSHGKSSKKPIKSTIKSTSLKSKLLAKLLLKPSMWLSCAQPNNQTLHQSTFYFAPSSSNAGATTTTSSVQMPIYASMIETNLNAAAVPQSTSVNARHHHHHRDDHSHDEVMKPAGSIILHTNRAGDTGYETLSTRYEAELVQPASALFQVP